VPSTGDAAAIAAAGRRYVDALPFRSSARLVLERVPGAGVVTNEPELLRQTPDSGEQTSVQRRENRQSRALVNARAGYSTVRLMDLGPLRLYTRPVHRAGRVVAVIGVGEPLGPVHRAQDDVARTFALAGTLTLLAALLASYLVAARTARPLRRMARIAARVDGGDLSPRIRAGGARDETRILADAFDHMLDRLEEAFARQTDFLADASHELRTPLTVLRGQLEVLARDPDFDRAGFDRVERLARAEIARMEKLVDDLLLIAHSDEPEFLHPVPVGLRPFLEDLVAGVGTTAPRRFEVAGDADGTVHADPERLAQALRNLLANAVEHTADGGLVRLVASESGGRLTLAVEDDGLGIPADQRDLVLERFHRVDTSRSRRTGGSGLGLAIARAIVQAHGGSISIGTSPAGGARVAVSLPGFVSAPAPARADEKNLTRP
jgi:signal transduction histidine kinase